MLRKMNDNFLMSHHVLCPLPCHYRDLFHPAIWCTSQASIEFDGLSWLFLDKYYSLISNSSLSSSSSVSRKWPLNLEYCIATATGPTSTAYLIPSPRRDRTLQKRVHNHHHTSQQRQHCFTPYRYHLLHFPHSAPSQLVKPSFAGVGQALLLTHVCFPMTGDS